MNANRAKASGHRRLVSSRKLLRYQYPGNLCLPLRPFLSEVALRCVSPLQQRGMERFQGGTGLRLNAELELVGLCLTLPQADRIVHHSSSAD